MIDTFNIIINCLVVVQAFSIIGLTAVSVAAYRKHSALKHIIAVSVAFIMLVLLSTYNIFTDAVPKFSWRALLAFIAYLLSDYSLIVLLRRGQYVDYYERLRSAGRITEKPKPLL